ncbi:DUF1836 domain-containing protein [Haloimpatiens sp. FM7330]|uniref:DUF1836 domain-containing protein n=1 Tax=Haloimpatiens sp. FM7330 TaxID=3298610 RepID=UPI0036404647
MNFDEQTLTSLVEDLNLNKDIKLSDIPQLDLYMDQIITLFENNLNHLKRNDKDKILTKTMINNYTKSKILMPPSRKKYSKEHIILLILIYNLKQGLSINDISLLFNDIVKNLKENEDIKLDSLYQTFLDIKSIQGNDFKNQFSQLLNLIKDKTNDSPDENIDLYRIVVTVLTLINESNIRRRMAEKIIDEYFVENLPSQ